MFRESKTEKLATFKFLTLKVQGLELLDNRLNDGYY